jgi:hypothetical protein
MNRAQRRAKQKLPVADIQKYYDNQLNKNLEIYTKTMINALVIAMNSELGIGRERGAKVLNEMNVLIENNSLDELNAIAIKRNLL